MNNKDKLDSSQLQQLLIAAQKGDQTAYHQFLSIILPFIHKKAKFKVYKEDDVSDVTQTIMMSIHQSLHTYDPKRSPLPWLITIIERRIIDYIRKVTSISENEALTDQGDVTIFEGVTNILLEENLEIFNCLSPELQKAIRLTKIEGHSTKEAADIIGIKENALRTRVSRALTIMKKSLREGEETHE